jgi:hypothetical protein
MAAVRSDVRPLFEAIGAAGVAATVGRLHASATGAVAELVAQGILIDRGHKVAVPVVDDDGVDLIVDYRTLVQVKTTGMVNGSGVPYIHFKRNSYRRRQDGTRVARGGEGIPAHVDVLLILVRDIGWYVVPRESAPASGVVFGPGMDQWREAWSVFD